VSIARTGRAPDLGLLRWEARRVQSARRAATLASVNTALGRPSGRGDVLRRTAVRAMLTGPSARLFARAYSMGFDVDA